MYDVRVIDDLGNHRLKLCAHVHLNKAVLAAERFNEEYFHGDELPSAERPEGWEHAWQGLEGILVVVRASYPRRTGSEARAYSLPLGSGAADKELRQLAQREACITNLYVTDAELERLKK